MNTTTFLLNLGLTVVLLGLTIRSGKMGVRKTHFYLVFFTLLSLLAAIYQAELYGRDFEFTSWRLNVHLSFAFAALASFPGVVFSGFKLINRSTWRQAHNRWVGSFVSLVGFSVITAVLMFIDAQSKT
ncbi:MAG: hypothetical protein H8E25_10645 [Planctomycetes bacterium]|nr:hypothetical protein [Planctomycetota bacterium]